MRIVILSETFTRRMGYIERQLPRALAALGADVHVVSANLQAYHNDPNYSVTYEGFLGPAVQPCGMEELEGFTLHRLPHAKLMGYVRIVGLDGYLASLKPDVVQTFAASSWIPLAAAASQPIRGYRLFTGAHQTASVVSPTLFSARRFSRERLRSDLRRAIPGRLVSLRTTLCYAATTDCADVAIRFYGVQRKKIAIAPLAVDVDMFHPALNQNEMNRAQAVRTANGAQAGDVVCLYTGRFSTAKNPLCLARAVSALRAAGLPFRAWFVGDGPQRELIAAEDGSVVMPFAKGDFLADAYRAADVGVWPTQESLSMLDCTACGTPIVVSDRLQAVERVEGNGLMYKEADHVDLARVLQSLHSVPLREELGRAGAVKVAKLFSWREHARRKLGDYEAALQPKWPRS